MGDIDLMAFCDDEDGNRVALQKPYSIGEFTYAADGHIGVRVPRRADVPENTEAPNRIVEIIRVPVAAGDIASKVRCPDLSKYPDRVECPKCHGKAGPKVCPECHGNRMMEFDSRYHHYQVECLECDGTGETGNCEECGNGGTIPNETGIDLGDKYVRVDLLKRVAALPNVEFAPSVTGGYSAIPFYFDGGVGVLMPMRRPDTP